MRQHIGPGALSSAELAMGGAARSGDTSSSTVNRPNRASGPRGGAAVMTEQKRRWVRFGLVYLTVTFLEVGLWATFAGRSFFNSFPGLGRRWVAGDGPYNAHLTSDAGVGFLAVGLVLLLAAVWMERRIMQAALAAAVLHGLGHLLFHLREPNDALGWVDQAMSNGGLVLGAALAATLLVVVARTPEPVRDAVRRDQER